MTALITLSHGSRNPRAALGATRLTDAANELLEGEATEVVAAHLEFTAPSLPKAANTLATAGHRCAVVVPLLFAGGFHAKYDVPEALRLAEAASQVQLILAEAIGSGDDVADVLAERIRAEAPAGAHVVLYSVGSADAEANTRVADLAARAGQRTGRSTQVIAATRPGEGIEAVVEKKGRVHVLPLFVSDGVLLDAMRKELAELDPRGERTSMSPPLTTDLAGIVADRYRCALAAEK